MTVLDKASTGDLVTGSDDHTSSRIDIGLVGSFDQCRVIQESLRCPEGALETAALLFQFGAHSTVNGERNSNTS